jgi:DNA repair protein RadD
VSETRQAFREGYRNVLLQAPTGFGKTVVAAYIMGSAAERGNEGMFICNRVELLDQTGRAFDKQGIRHSYISPDHRPDYMARTQIASIDTLKRRIAKGLVKPPKLAVWDECRSIAAKGWAGVHAWLAENGALQLGLDATPERHDGKPLGPYVDKEGVRFEGFFQHLVHGPAYSELMALGNLVPFECYGSQPLDLSGVRMKGYDFDATDVEAVVDKPHIVGDVVDHYLKRANGLLGLTFAVSRKHSEHLAEAYRAAGVRAVHLDGDTEAGERKRMVAAYRRGEIEVLTNVDLFTAGFDVPGVEVISDAAPSKSRPKTLQKWGRGSRPDEENPAKRCCILLDHAGNLKEHGFPDDDRTWSLDGQVKQKTGKAKSDSGEGVNVRQCEECFHVHRPAPACPQCGFVYPIQYREVEERDGELKKLSKEELRAERLALREAKAAERAAEKREREVRVHLGKKAKSLEELLQIERERGYQPGWAQGVWTARSIAREAMAQKIAEQQFRAYGR